MSAQKRAGTAPELALRRLMHARGHRYLVDAPLPITGVRRRSDLLFRGPRVAVFVDGCFWHCCPEHGTLPKRNSHWWQDKLQANVARDQHTDQLLAAAGWQSVRFWEHTPPAEAVQQLESILAATKVAARRTSPSRRA